MPNKPAPSQIQDRYIVRMPDGMRDRIAEVAKANNRSMNAEIVARLQNGLSGGRLLKTDDQGHEVEPSAEDKAMFAFFGALDDLKRAVSAFENAKHAIAEALGVDLVEATPAKRRPRK